MTKRKKIVEVFNIKRGKVIQAVFEKDSTIDKSSFMFDFVMAQIEVYTVMDEMELDTAIIDKN